MAANAVPTVNVPPPPSPGNLPNEKPAGNAAANRKRGQLSRDYSEPFIAAVDKAIKNGQHILSSADNNPVQAGLQAISDECKNDMKKMFREVLRVQNTVDAAVNFYTQYLFQREPAVRSFFGYNDDTDLQQLAFKSYDFSSFVASVMCYIRGLTESLDDPGVFDLMVKKVGRVHATVTGLQKPWLYYYGECLLEYVKQIILDPNAPSSEAESNNFKRMEAAYRQVWYLVVEHAWKWTEIERENLRKQQEEAAAMQKPTSPHPAGSGQRAVSPTPSSNKPS